MIREAIEYLHTLGKSTPQVVNVWEEDEMVLKLVSFSDGKSEIKPFVKREKDFKHTLYTLEDFVAFFNTDFPDPVMIFVQLDGIFADLAYQTHKNHHVVMPLLFSAEFNALTQLIQGVGQKDLWKLLITDLDGCLPETLLAAIGRIQVSTKTEGQCEIKSTGETIQEGKSGIKIVFQPKEGAEFKEATIPLDWEWKGRIWECFDEVCSIRLRMEIDTKNGMRFIFNPRQLDRVLTQHRQALVQKLRDDLPGFYIYQGTY